MSTTEKPPRAAAPKKATPTEYVVLVQQPDGNWKVGSTHTTTGSTAAIKAHIADGKDAKVSALVAVPARSWQPVKPKTTTKTITTLESLK